MKNEDLYMCSRDYQGDDFGFYRAFTIEQWREQALEWCDTDCNEELYKTIKNLPKKYVLDYIQDIWTIKIDKIDKDKIVKYFVDYSSENYSFLSILRKTKQKLKENNIKFVENEWENEIYYNEIDRLIKYFEKNDEILYEKEN